MTLNHIVLLHNQSPNSSYKSILSTKQSTETPVGHFNTEIAVPILSIEKLPITL